MLASLNAQAQGSAATPPTADSCSLCRFAASAAGHLLALVAACHAGVQQTRLTRETRGTCQSSLYARIAHVTERDSQKIDPAVA